MPSYGRLLANRATPKPNRPSIPGARLLDQRRNAPMTSAPPAHRDGPAPIILTPLKDGRMQNRQQAAQQRPARREPGQKHPVKRGTRERHRSTHAPTIG